MPKTKHDASELEFAAKRVNDLLQKRFSDRHLGFMTFVFDYGADGFLGYISSAKRVDAFRMITEWLEESLKGFSREDVREILKQYESEL